ncbi:hypothetical protein AMAG_16919 [Allomyces macrogynus ATCC 38327]|uniref:Uncharacterized protein n=1 Tax=Allomyces macrogynus (strain ATCC 38327) TaxID=578462 RepID=A0A0L0TD26_ALLM3|nr:hypothetical protein AMAG_16919 [Allomyces macrogynus ATCC 38327]|eukprot:KNE72813.1 hypothetical protein AMAG_16919 [Allomyces macrogynus ATCC 38327]
MSSTDATMGSAAPPPAPSTRGHDGHRQSARQRRRRGHTFALVLSAAVATLALTALAADAGKMNFPCKIHADCPETGNCDVVRQGCMPLHCNKNDTCTYFSTETYCANTLICMDLPGTSWDPPSNAGTPTKPLAHDNAPPSPWSLASWRIYVLIVGLAGVAALAYVLWRHFRASRTKQPDMTVLNVPGVGKVDFGLQAKPGSETRPPQPPPGAGAGGASSAAASPRPTSLASPYSPTILVSPTTIAGGASVVGSSVGASVVGSNLGSTTAVGSAVGSPTSPKPRPTGPALPAGIAQSPPYPPQHVPRPASPNGSINSAPQNGTLYTSTGLAVVPAAMRMPTPSPGKPVFHAPPPPKAPPPAALVDLARKSRDDSPPPVILVQPPTMEREDEDDDGTVVYAPGQDQAGLKLMPEGGSRGIAPPEVKTKGTVPRRAPPSPVKEEEEEAAWEGWAKEVMAAAHLERGESPV